MSKKYITEKRENIYYLQGLLIQQELLQGFNCHNAILSFREEREMYLRWSRRTLTSIPQGPDCWTLSSGQEPATTELTFQPVIVKTESIEEFQSAAGDRVNFHTEEAATEDGKINKSFFVWR